MQNGIQSDFRVQYPLRILIVDNTRNCEEAIAFWNFGIQFKFFNTNSQLNKCDHVCQISHACHQVKYKNRNPTFHLLKHQDQTRKDLQTALAIIPCKFLKRRSHYIKLAIRIEIVYMSENIVCLQLKEDWKIQCC